MTEASPFQNAVVHRLGLLAEPSPERPEEAGGVFNPAAARGPDGTLHLFPRQVDGAGVSRIGVARVRYDAAGDPSGIERVGTAIEPDAGQDDAQGCEDPRVTFVEPLGRYLMAYTGKSPDGPRLMLAESRDLLEWRRLGPVRFPGGGFEGDDKNGCLFPRAVRDAAGRPALALLHRPQCAPGQDDSGPGIWLATRPLDAADPCAFSTHKRLAMPERSWESAKIGAGPPPVATSRGWLLVYHGVEASDPLRYSVGLMLLDLDDPSRVLHRTAEPVLRPEMPYERDGATPDTVFPTGIDRRDDLGPPNRFDFYYGAGDSRIGAARLDLSFG